MRRPVSHSKPAHSGSGPAKRRSPSPGSRSIKFGGFRADGGTVDPGKAFVVGEKGPETFVQSPVADADGRVRQTRPVVAIGGMFSVLGSPFFNAVDTMAPASTKVPLGGVSVDDGYKLISDALRPFGTNEVVAVAHSKGATQLYNLLHAHPDRYRNVRPMYIDPAVNTPWPNRGFSNLIPISRAINESINNGIQYDPNLFDYTNGRAVTLGPRVLHNPFANPNAPGAAPLINNFTNSLRANMGIPGPIVAPRPIPRYAHGGRPQTGQVSIVGENGPELFVPDVPGTIIPNHGFAPALSRLF